MKEIDIYQAFREMKKITDAGGTFSITFRKWDRSRRKGGDVVKLMSVRLRKKTSDEEIAHSSYKLFLRDVETSRALVCWQCLVMEFNGMKIKI